MTGHAQAQRRADSKQAKEATAQSLENRQRIQQEVTKGRRAHAQETKRLEQLNLPLRALLATTYQEELARISDMRSPSHHLLNPSFSFHLCPACVQERRMLLRSFALQHITCCPQHQIALVASCSCGAPLRPFRRQALPFTCYKCGLSWAQLPRQEALLERLELERRLLSFYDFFFAQGSPQLLADALRLIYDSVVEKGEIRAPTSGEEAQFPSERSPSQRTSSLGYVVYALLQLDLTPRDILIYSGPLPWRSVKWITFECSISHCPSMDMLHGRVHEAVRPEQRSE